MTIQDFFTTYYPKINHLDLELIISRVIKKPREFVIAHEEHEISKKLEVKSKKYIERRIAGEPLAYIFGEKEFYGLNFKVNKNVLIPRPETEMIVEEALRLATCNSQLAAFADVGTGSGCIIITLAKKLLNNESGIINYEFMGIDISKSALKIARQNAKLHKVDKKIKFLHGNLLEPILKQDKFDTRHSTLVILANLPYGWSAWKNNSSADTIGLKYEPSIALFTGNRGLGLYKKLFNQVSQITNPPAGRAGSKLQITILCEIDPRQTTAIKKIIKKNLPAARVEIKKDLSGLNRLIMAQIN